jgi:hypothetical protein
MAWSFPTAGGVKVIPLVSDKKLFAPTKIKMSSPEPVVMLSVTSPPFMLYVLSPLLLIIFSKIPPVFKL